MATANMNHEQREEDRNWKSPRKKKQLANLTDWKSIEDDREKYAAYLCSREWSVLKEQVKKRSRGRCERCRIFDGDAVHHLTYERKYNERLEDLQHTCKHCHSFIHGKSLDDPCKADRQVLLCLNWCKKNGRIPLPFGVLVGLDSIDSLERSIEELIRGAFILCAADLEMAACTLCESLPFQVPGWFVRKDHIPDPEIADLAFRLVGFSTGRVDESWWEPSEDDDEA